MRQVSRGLDQWEPERGSMRIDASAQKNLTLIGGSPLAVEVEVAPHADVSAANECRSTAIDLAGETNGYPAAPKSGSPPAVFPHGTQLGVPGGADPGGAGRLLGCPVGTSHAKRPGNGHGSRRGSP